MRNQKKFEVMKSRPEVVGKRELRVARNKRKFSKWGTVSVFRLGEVCVVAVAMSRRVGGVKLLCPGDVVA